jgi:hypothetical protein
MRRTEERRASARERETGAGDGNDGERAPTVAYVVQRSLIDDGP